MEDKKEAVLKSDLNDTVKDEALEVVKEVLENIDENIVLERKVSSNPGLASICEETPEETVEAPEEPVEAPEEPVEAPEEPVETPEEPVDTPEEPVDTPEEPVETPEELDVINLEIEEELVEISVEPDNKKIHTEIVGEKCCCSLWIW